MLVYYKPQIVNIYIHCFSHHIQLALVAIPKNHVEIVGAFLFVVYVVNVIGASTKSWYI